MKKIGLTNENSDIWTHQKIAPSKNEDSSRHLFEFWEEAKKKGGYSNNDDIPSFMVINIDQLTYPLVN